MTKKQITIKEELMSILNFWKESAETELAKVKTNINENSFSYSLEWNRLEVGALEEMKLRTVNRIIKLLRNEGNIEFFSIIEENKQKISDELTGTGFLGGGSGPWESRSTSPGSRRLAIVQANFKREEINICNELLKFKK
jgi:hypothetical protein